PGSGSLQQLNSASNLTRETQQIAGRVGVANIMSNYAYGGPFRAVTPENADAITRAFYGIIAALEYRASWIFAHAPHGDVAAIQQGQALLSLAGHLRLLDPVY